MKADCFKEMETQRMYIDLLSFLPCFSRGGVVLSEGGPTDYSCGSSLRLGLQVLLRRLALDGQGASLTLIIYALYLSCCCAGRIVLETRTDDFSLGTVAIVNAAMTSDESARTDSGSERTLSTGCRKFCTKLYPVLLPGPHTVPRGSTPASIQCPGGCLQ